MSTALALVPKDPALAEVAPGLRQSIETAVTDAALMRRAVEDWKVTDPASVASLTEQLSLLSYAAKEAEAIRLSLTKPLKTKAKAIEDALRPLSTVLDEAIAIGKRKQLDWHRAEEARVARERAEAERVAFEAQAAAVAQSAQTGKPVEMPALVAVVVPVIVEASRGVKTDYGTTHVRKVWKFEVTDSALVPRQFLTVDEQAIRRAVADGARTIEGVRIYQDEQLSVRAS